jgi:hypothetical protein
MTSVIKVTFRLRDTHEEEDDKDIFGQHLLNFSKFFLMFISQTLN